MNPFFNPLTRQMDVGPDAGENVSVTGNTVNFIGGGTGGAVYNAGAGLTLEGNVFTANVAAAGAGLTLTGGTASADVAAVGFGMELAGGTASYARYRNIETVTGSSVTLMAGHAYKVYATSAAITINTETIPANMYGQEGHLEIFVAGTGYVQTGANVVLSQALEPDAVNNCTVRFHDGLAIISVEDHVAGYIVVSATGTSSGSLYYGLATSTNEYIAVDASLNGTPLDMSGAVTNGEKHVVGNGYTETIISGGINCTSKTTFANLAMNGVIVSSGTLTLGDVYIPSGATVAVSGGGLAVEKVTGAGSESVIDLGRTNVVISSGGTAYASGCTITGGSAANGGAIYGSKTSMSLYGCIISGNTATTRAGAFRVNNTTTLVSGCSIYGNVASNTFVAGTLIEDGTAEYSNSFVDHTSLDYNTTLHLVGSNRIDTILPINTTADTRKNNLIIVSSGATIDLTGNTNATPITPGGGITFAPGGATILTGGTAGVVDAQYTLGGMTIPQIGNTNVVNLNSSNVAVSSGVTAYASGCMFSGGSAATGGVMYASGGAAQFTDCIFTGNTGETAKVFEIRGNSGHVSINGCTFSGNSGVNQAIRTGSATATLEISNCYFSTGEDIYVTGTPGLTIKIGGTNTIDRIRQYGPGSASVTISSGASINLTSSIAPGGGITVLEGGCTINSTPVSATGETPYNSIVNSGGTLYIDGEPVE